jgi:hypothetical protein
MSPPFKDCYVQVSTDGTNWTDLSDTASVEIVTGTGSRKTTHLKPYGLVNLIIPGPLTYMKIIVTYSYADATKDDTIRAAYEAGSAFYVRYAPRGNTTGNFLYTSAAGIITSLPIPEGQRHSGAIVLNRFAFETPRFTKTVIGSS